MSKKIYIVIAALGLTLNNAACTSGSKESAEEGQQQQQEQSQADSAFTQEGEGDLAQQKDAAPQDQLQGDESQQVAKSDDLQQQQLQKDQAATPQDSGQDLALDGQQELPDDLAGTTDPASQPAGQQKAEAPAPAAGQESASAMPNTPPPVSDESLFKEAPAAETAAAAPEAKPSEPAAAPSVDVAQNAEAAPMAPKAFAPLQKVKDAAFEKGGKNLNRYYIARTTDKSLKAISEKIYGKDRSKDLKSWNPSLANRKPKVGDKIYYQSSANPDDTAMMSYYEEAGIEPVTYTSVEGDNIRKLSKSWLGSTESWKEVWSTNASLESKGSIPAGVEIKYWPAAAAAAAAPVPVAETKPSVKDQAATPPQVADNDAPPPPPIDDFAPPADPTAMGETAGKKPEPGAASNPQPASTPDKEVAAATVTTEPPPPPPPAATEQAPPPPPPVTKKAAAPKEEGDDTMFAMGVGGVLLMAAAVLFVLVRKNRAKRVDLGQTQV